MIGRYLRSAMCLVAVSAGLFGCQHPENYRWSGNADFVVAPEVVTELEAAYKQTNIDYSQPWVDVYTFAAPPKDAPPGLNIKDLNGPGQAKAIEVLTRKGAKPADIWGALAPPAREASVNPSITPTRELYRFDRNLVAVVNKGLAARPGERLMWTWVLIKPVNFEFTGYSIVQTDNQTLNIEQVMHQTTTQVQGQVSATVPAGLASVNPSLSGSVQNQFTTSAAIAQQYEKLGVDIVPRFLRIYRESERNLDVAGNTVVSLSLVADPNKLENGGGAEPAVTLLRAFSLKLSRSGELLAPKDASLEIELIKSPLHCPLRAQVRLISQFRRIKSDNASYNEGEHKVSIEQIATPWRKVDLVSADDAVPAAFGVYYSSQESRKPVYATTPNGDRLQLAFADYEAAQAMANWMNTQRAHTIGRPGLLLTLGGVPIPNPYPLLHAERIGDGGRTQEAQKQLCDATVLKIVDDSE